MKTIWKYQLGTRGAQKLQIPSGATLLSVKFQHSYHYRQLCAWFLLDPEMKSEERTFRIFRTGQPVEDVESLTYLNTVQDGDLMRHIFEEPGMWPCNDCGTPCPKEDELCQPCLDKLITAEEWESE